MTIAIVLLLALHGFAHLVGFAGPWGLIEGGSIPTTILMGRVAVSAGTMKALGLLWLTLAIVFIVSAVGVARHLAWWPQVVGVTAAASLAMCLLFLPDSKIGVVVNALILAALYLAPVSAVGKG